MTTSSRAAPESSVARTTEDLQALGVCSSEEETARRKVQVYYSNNDDKEVKSRSNNGGKKKKTRSVIMQNKKHHRYNKSHKPIHNTPSSAVTEHEMTLHSFLESEKLGDEQKKILLEHTSSRSTTSLRRTRSMDNQSSTKKELVSLRASKSEESRFTQKLDKFGFILNMDDQGNIYHDALTNEKIPTFAEARLAENRERKWQNMLEFWDSFRGRKILLTRLRKGVPDSMRGDVWCMLANVQQKKKKHPGYYAELVMKSTRSSSNGAELLGYEENTPPRLSLANAIKDATSFRAVQDTIDRDIHRTFPRHTMFHEEEEEEEDGSDSNGILSTLNAEDAFDCVNDKQAYSIKSESKGGQASLRRVLRAYSLHDPEVGYCQGMNFIAAMLLTFMPEDEAFLLLVAVMYDPPCKMRGMFGKDMKATHQVLHVADKLIHQFLPKLAKHLDKENIHITMYATQWLLTMYTSNFNFDLVTRVWDCFLVEGRKAPYRIMLALMQQSMPVLMTLTFEQILAHFRDIPDKVTGSSIMETALKIPLKTKHIVKFEKEWLAAQQQLE